MLVLRLQIGEGQRKGVSCKVRICDMEVLLPTSVVRQAVRHYNLLNETNEHVHLYSSGQFYIS